MIFILAPFPVAIPYRQAKNLNERTNKVVQIPVAIPYRQAKNTKHNKQRLRNYQLQFLIGRLKTT